MTTSKRDGTNASTKTFTYDTTHPDRLVNYNGTTIPYDSYGYPTSYNGWTLTWSRGRLTRMSKGTKQTGQETYSYTYNAFGQRTKKTYSYLNTSAGFQPVYQGMVISSTTVYEYDNSGRLVRETVNENHFEGTTSGRTLVYLYDASSMIGVRVITESTTDTYYYNRNLQGDVTEIYDVNGTLKVSYKYDAYGNCTVSGTDTSLGNLNPIRYRGYYYDKETNFYHLGARYYNPEWRRFISPDDTSYIDPETPNGLNLYCYCNNDPINFVDPSGHFGITTAILIGAFIGGVLSATTSVAIQLYENNGDWSALNLYKIIYDGAFGVLNGALAASGIGIWWSIGIGAVTGAASSIGNDLLFNNGQIDWYNALDAFLIGGIAGAIAGAGANNIKSGMHVTKFINSRSILNRTIANGTKSVIARQTHAMMIHANQLAISGARYLLSNMFSTAANSY